MDPPNHAGTGTANNSLRIPAQATHDNLFLQQETNMRIIRAPAPAGEPKLELINGVIKNRDRVVFQTHIKPDDTFIQEEYVGGVIKSIRLRQLALLPPFFPIGTYTPVNILEISCRVNIKWAFTFIANLPALTFVRFGSGVFEELVELHDDELRWPLCPKNKVQELHIRVDPIQCKNSSNAATRQVVSIVNTIFRYAGLYLKYLEHAELLVPSKAMLNEFLNRQTKITENGKEKKENFEDGTVFFTTNRLCNIKSNTEVCPTPGSGETTAMQEKKETFCTNWNRQDLGQHARAQPPNIQEFDVSRDREAINSPSPVLAPVAHPPWSPAYSSSTGSGGFSPSPRQVGVKRKTVDDEYDDDHTPYKDHIQSFQGDDGVRVSEECPVLFPPPPIPVQGDDGIKISEEYRGLFSRSPPIPVSEQFPSFANPIRIHNIPGLFEGVRHQIKEDQFSNSSFDSNETDDLINMVPRTRIEERSSVSNHQGQPQPVPPPDPVYHRSESHEVNAEVINLRDDEEYLYPHDDAKFRTMYRRRF